MKAVIIVGLFLFLNTNLNAQVNRGINFQDIPNWAEVTAKAKKENKYIFIDAFATWCGPCKQMDSEVYINENVGTLLNKNFISIKIQMDSTANDNHYIKSWYADAKTIAQQTKIKAFPTYIFYSPDGALIYKSIGFQQPEKFMKTVDFAINSERRDFRNQLIAYQNGVRDYPKMGDLAVATKELTEDKKLADSIAIDYKENYLDKLPASRFLTKENILFIHNNGSGGIVNSRDLFFLTSYNHPQVIDSIIGTGLAQEYVWYVLNRELVGPRLLKDNKPVSKNPDWDAIADIVKKKYPKLNITDFMTAQKVGYYRNVKNWDLYTLYKTEQVEKDISKNKDLDVFFALNFPAWDVFQKSNNKKALERALYWSKMSIDMSKNDDVKIQFLDTKANLLYKLGRVDDAIAAEQEAVEFTKAQAKKSNKETPDFIDVFEMRIKKMKAGQPTWPVPTSK